MKKLLSDMTSTKFIDYQHALGMSGDELAVALGKSPATISKYRTGANSIPLDTHKRIAELMLEKAKVLGMAGMDLDRDHDAIVGAAVIFNNTKGERKRKERMPVFNNHANNPARRERELRLVLGPYRITMPRMAILKRGLVALAQTLMDQTRAFPESRTIAVALADLKSVAEQVSGLDQVTPPFTMAPTYAEWRIISAAIRSQPEPAAYAFYQHWRRYMGSGWPVYRNPVKRVPRADGTINPQTLPDLNSSSD